MLLVMLGSLFGSVFLIVVGVVSSGAGVELLLEASLQLCNAVNTNKEKRIVLNL